MSNNIFILIFLSILINRLVIFLISILSATAATGLLLSKFKLLIFILCLSEITFPLHLLGLKGLIGVTPNFPELSDKMGPLIDKL